MGRDDLAELTAYQQGLLDPHALAENIQFQGNRPILNPEYRRQILLATLPATAVEAVRTGPLGALLRSVRLASNLKRIRINRKYCGMIVELLDNFDHKLEEIYQKTEEEPEIDLRKQSLISLTQGLAEDLEAIWEEYQVKYSKARI